MARESFTGGERSRRRTWDRFQCTGPQDLHHAVKVNDALAIDTPITHPDDWDRFQWERSQSAPPSETEVLS
ncbi:hypothetical protein GCM10010247_25620 [Streptomyces calvus]|nr:hypothetical protein GCM10010247_25620 [Streptomyces calvus]